MSYAASRSSRILAGVAVASRAAAALAAERARLAPWLAVALGAGVLAYFALPEEPPAAAIWVAPPLLALALWLGLRQPLAGWALGLLAAGALGFAAAAWQAGRQPPMPDLPRGATLVAARVAAVELLPEGQRLTLEAARLDGGAPLARQIRVRLKTEDPARPQPGDTVRLRALVRPPAPPAHPGAWDFQRAAWFSGLGGSGFALGRAEVTPGEAGGPALATLRAAIEARVTAAIPGPAGAVAAALLTGGQSAIPPVDLAAMRDSGLAHLLSVSGLHIAIVMGVSFAVLRLLLVLSPWLALRVPAKAVAAVAALGVGGLYLLLTGAAVPMQRSFAMAALATLALLTGRRALSLRAWALAAAAVLLVQPAAVLGASFQMSFAAVLALIAGWEWLRPRLPRAGPGRARWRRRLALAGFGVVATSILAGAATTPFGLHHFGRLQLYGVAANALAVPITSALVMPAGMAAVALMPFGLEGLALAPMGWGVEAILAVARWVAGWPGAALAVAPIPAWGLGLCAFGMLWLCLWLTPMRLLGVPLILAGLASGAWQRPPDILVSADARLIGLRDGEGLAIQRLSGASGLTRETWLRLFGAAEAAALPREGTSEGGAIACRPAACTLRPDPGGPAAVLLRTGPAAEACAGAALVVSAEPVRGRCAAQVIDRFAVWRNGAHAVWLERDGVRMLSDRAARGARPWVPPVPVPRGTPSADPPAPVE
ncbi:ComEC/Rec2 family competence protein [Paracraurococcus lichenis]|uniref:ComEC/Rec2 family competence protein n=1 Tax=Paracraurococcus lichenis TaxID=3064888 RepID=A0ABT9E7N7_9PROT|nr:ComEC/Rec2 family competence protein [Paracraurococcus sp. LOR1-02]MDO9712085.1 ComEC/Rec2 family competence protein [Paracraurococcus sp. LOR1-02]